MGDTTRRASRWGALHPHSCSSKGPLVTPCINERYSTPRIAVTATQSFVSCIGESGVPLQKERQRLWILDFGSSIFSTNPSPKLSDSLRKHKIIRSLNKIDFNGSDEENNESSDVFVMPHLHKIALLVSKGLRLESQQVIVDHVHLSVIRSFVYSKFKLKDKVFERQNARLSLDIYSLLGKIGQKNGDISITSLNGDVPARKRTTFEGNNYYTPVDQMTPELEFKPFAHSVQPLVPLLSTDFVSKSGTSGAERCDLCVTAYRLILHVFAGLASRSEIDPLLDWYEQDEGKNSSLSSLSFRQKLSIPPWICVPPKNLTSYSGPNSLCWKKIGNFSLADASRYIHEHDINKDSVDTTPLNLKKCTDAERYRFFSYENNSECSSESSSYIIEDAVVSDSESTWSWGDHVSY